MQFPSNLVSRVARCNMVDDHKHNDCPDTPGPDCVMASLIPKKNLPTVFSRSSDGATNFQSTIHMLARERNA